MLRAAIFVLLLSGASAPTEASKPMPRKTTTADLPPCVTLPSMAKGKKCRELPAMAAPEQPGEELRRIQMIDSVPAHPPARVPLMYERGY